VLDILLESGFNKEDFLMADIRSLTTLLETNFKQGKGTVGWGTFEADTLKSKALILCSAILPPGCGRHSKDDICAEIARLGEGGGTNAQIIRGRCVFHVSC
jgi:hypothetical protein